MHVREELVCVVNQSVISSFWGLRHELEAGGGGAGGLLCRY